eukprot:NODE_6942_length_826_cov_62.402560_g6342_i0.p1 GENE.NODE_6942_length_826_cov_62.402560_g6342_i0~~NODE_6942_length_826_cov_62.402560_g6342_i0.p1  ORF type:complete len:219 (-),score=46.65 NODE_6942_length_826_cov_62.402560_g6342_i0:109-765(-)
MWIILPLLFSAVFCEDAVLKLSGSSFDKYIGSELNKNVPLFIQFYEPGKELKVWSDFAEQYKYHVFVVAELDVSASPDVKNSQSVTTTPAFKWITNGEAQTYSGEHTVEAFKEFVKGKLGKDFEPDDEDKPILDLFGRYDNNTPPADGSVSLDEFKDAITKVSKLLETPKEETESSYFIKYLDEYDGTTGNDLRFAEFAIGVAAVSGDEQIDLNKVSP